MSISNENVYTEKHCTYDTVQDCVHVFRVRKPTRQAVDEYLTKLAALFEAHPDDEPFLFIVDVRKGMPSFAYTMQRSRQFIRTIEMPSNIRVVYLHHNNPILHTMGVFLSTQRLRSERLILNGDREDDALVWLFSEARAHQHVATK
ncbi:MAG: hypothetical protein AAFV33_09640 [Chloroflexota bacterium]